MRKPLLAALSVVMMVAACGTMKESRLNPFNWFGKSKETQGALYVPSSQVTDSRPLVDQIVTMQVEKLPGGAIVRATGLPPTQGYWEGALVADPVVKGTLTLRFVIVPPAEATRVSTQQSREVVVATFLSTQTLAEVRTITVVGAQNARSSRR